MDKLRAGRKKRYLNPNKRVKLLIIFLLWLLHICLYYFFSSYDGVLMLTLLPVSITGLFFGSRWGLLSGIFSYILNSILILSFSDTSLLFNYAFIMGGILTASLGFIIGKLYDYNQRIKIELKERKRIENELQDTNTKMEEMHRLATEFTNIFSEQDLFEASLKGMKEILGYDKSAFYRLKGKRIELITSTEKYHGIQENINHIYKKTINEGFTTFNSSQSIISVPVDKEAIFLAVTDKDNNIYKSELIRLLITHI